jgi:hypothetical protein
MATRSKASAADVERKLEALDALAGEKDRAARAEGLAAALADRHYRVAAKAAKLIGGALLYDLVPNLAAAYARFSDKPLKSDPNCIAKKAIARALLDLDYGDVDFWLAALRYRQLEPVWGGSRDTATDVRATSAMALVATGYSRALAAITDLLHDPEPDARAGALRAIACGNPREAELLLRSKVLAGDAEPAVHGEAMGRLLGVAPDESIALVARFLADASPAVRELAALALGESRHAGALAALQAAWADPLPPPELRGALLRAVALHRSDAALAWLVALAAEGDERTAVDVVEALVVYRHNPKLAAELEAALAARGDDAPLRALRERWRLRRQE